MIALSYRITYFWGTVGIILICKYLPRWWLVNVCAAAKEYVVAHGEPNVDDAGLSGYRRFELRLPAHERRPDRQDRGAVSRALCTVSGRERGARPATAGRRPGVGNSPIAGQVKLVSMERVGAPFPIGLQTRLQRLNVLHFVGLRSAIDKATAILGKVARPSTATDLLTLSLGVILGLLIGLVQVPAFGATVGMGNAGGLLVSGIIVSSLVSRVRFFGNTPNAARNILEDIGLIFFVAIVGVNAGAKLLS